MTILDTNVISAMMQDPPEPQVVAWLDSQARSSLWTTSVTVLEIESGLRIMPAGKRQVVLSRVYERILNGIEHRIAVFDEMSAREAAQVMASRRKRGSPVEIRDTMIAGIVLSRHASLATRNVLHFADIAASVINPWAT